MNVFVTGAAGFIGGSIATGLVKAGHHVTGLVRSADQAAEMTALGITPVIGTLDDRAVLTEQATQADAVINAASSDHRAAVETLLAALKGSNKPFLHTSGSSIVGDAFWQQGERRGEAGQGVGAKTGEVHEVPGIAGNKAGNGTEMRSVVPVKRQGRLTGMPRSRASPLPWFDRYTRYRGVNTVKCGSGLAREGCTTVSRRHQTISRRIHSTTDVRLGAQPNNSRACLPRTRLLEPRP